MNEAIKQRESTSSNVKHFSIEFDTKYIVQLISQTPTNQNMIMYKLKTF